MLKRGFTLIELLIVVAIIAILAAIAVPNFLEAQVRAKVSRAKSDLRSFATAIEAYTTDHNKPPPQSIGGQTGVFNPIPYKSYQGTGTLTHALTTPVAYMTTFMIFDAFTNQDESIDIDQRLFSYHAYPWVYDKYQPTSNPSALPRDADTGSDRLTRQEFAEHYGHWRIFSIGPDRTFYNRRPINSGPFPVGTPYDPTNGTISMGNIIRSQKQPEQRTWKAIL